MHEEVRQRVASTRATNQRISLSDWSFRSNRTGELSEIASVQADRPFAVREETADVHIVAYEEFSTDGSGGNTETFNLNYDIVDADSVANDLVLYNDNTPASPDTVDYAANSFDFSDAGTDSTLHAYYVVGDQARLEFRASGPRNHYYSMKEVEAGLENLRDQNKDPVEFDFNSYWERWVPSDWELKVLLNSSYDFQYVDDTDTDATADNLFLDVPIRQFEQPIPGLETAVVDHLNRRRGR